MSDEAGPRTDPPPPTTRARSEILLNALQTAAILVGLVYGGIQVAELRGEQRRQGNIELARSFMTPEFNEGMAFIITMPPDATPEQMMAGAPRVLLVMQTFEVVGVLVHQGDLDLRVADEFLGGGIVGAWERLRPWVESYRADMNDPHAQEWFQWLAERLQEHRGYESATPAYEAHRDWEMHD